MIYLVKVRPVSKLRRPDPGYSYWHRVPDAAEIADMLAPDDVGSVMLSRFRGDEDALKERHGLSAVPWTEDREEKF